MATVRITRELLEYALDLPPGNQLTLTAAGEPVIVEGVECFQFTLVGESETIPAQGAFALQYAEDDDGLHLVSAVPVD